MPRPKSILWVDDEVESLTSHILFLEEQGFAVETTAHGDDALVLLQRQPYGVVLLDEQMPGRRGLELFQAIRFAPEHPRAGVVILIEPGDTGTRERAHQLGAAAVVSKPIRGEELVEAVEDLLSFI